MDRAGPEPRLDTIASSGLGFAVVSRFVPRDVAAFYVHSQFGGTAMPRSATTLLHCSWCHVVIATAKTAAQCPLCDGVMLKGDVPHGTYAPMSSDEKHEVFARMARTNCASRATT